MKRFGLKKVADNIQNMMANVEMTPKKLSELSGISYTSLMPILNGNRDCGISKLMDIAEALKTTPNTILEGTYSEILPNSPINQTTSPKFYAVFISLVKMTYCVLFDITNNKKAEMSKQFPLLCGIKPSETLSDIASTINELRKKLNYKKNINLKEVAIFMSVQQFDRLNDRHVLNLELRKNFAYHIVEADYTTNYHALVGNKNAVCISINDGCVLTYSTDKGKDIHRLLGYGFPISDIAGNYWLGCKAISHTINVDEEIEKNSTLSDRLLAQYEGNIRTLAEAAVQSPNKTYLAASAIVKELVFKQLKSYDIVKESAELLLTYLKIISKRTKQKMGVLLAGELAYLYQDFFEKEKLMVTKTNHKTLLIKYGHQEIMAKATIKPHETAQ